MERGTGRNEERDEEGWREGQGGMEGTIGRRGERDREGGREGGGEREGGIGREGEREREGGEEGERERERARESSQAAAKKCKSEVRVEKGERTESSNRSRTRQFG